MTIKVTIHPNHVFRIPFIYKGLRFEGLRKVEFPSEGIITGEATPEVLAKISTIVGIESIESVPQQATPTLSYSG